MLVPHNLPHTIDINDDGWTVHHQAVCTVPTPDDGPRVVCLIEDLAAEQPPHLLYPAGRYVAATDLNGTRLELTPVVQVSA